jgi:hypothetical protein
MMKKLFALIVAAGMLSGLYGFSVGLGVRYDNLAGPEGTDPYFSIRADVMCKPFPILGLRMGVIQIDLPTDNTGIHIGTGVNADVLVYVPMAGMVKPYIVAGFWYTSQQDMYTDILLHGGLGAEVGFGGFAGYLEAAFNLDNLTPEGMDGESNTWFYGQLGVRVPIGL